MEKLKTGRGVQKQQAATRLFSRPSNNQGFKYIYLHTRARIPIRQVRQRLCRMGINTNRILDIHYPTRNVVTMLVHLDFVDTFQQQLKRCGVVPILDFNPL
jgi:hypothetical protein